MILAKLKEFADTQMDLPPEMYGEVKIRWMIELGEDGTFENFTPLGGNSKADKRGLAYRVPNIVRSVNVKPKLLVDNAEYVLGVARPTSKPDRVDECHHQFVNLVRRCVEETNDPSVKSILCFLENLTVDQLRFPEDFDPADTLTFRVHSSTGSVIPADARANLVRIQSFWARYTAEGHDDQRIIMTCLVTGESGPVEQRLPEKIKGIPKGQTTGTALVSANSPAFTSYRLENSLTSPISRKAGERFAKALNHLIATKDTRIYLGPLVYVFWTREKTEFDFVSYLEQPDPKAVKYLYDSARSGQPVHELKQDKFYALALSASGGRAVVRDWLETTIPAAEDSLRRWFNSQRIVNAYGQPCNPLGVYPLASSAYRDAKKEMTAAVPAALMRLALGETYAPNDLLARAVNRNRTERGVTRPRAALIKLILTTQGVDMTNMESLNPNPGLQESERVAYHCGRLLAELEAAQRAALGKVNATLTDRYYGSASSTPAKVFSVLLRACRTHLSKLSKVKPSTYNAIDQRLQEIMVAIGTTLSPEMAADHEARHEQIQTMMIGHAIPNFPKTLNMSLQGIFALGYYHQRAADRAAAIAAKEAQEGVKTHV